MTMFTVPIGNHELPKEYQEVSIDLAGLMLAIKETDPKRYIRELLLSMDNIEKIYIKFENWEKVMFRAKLQYLVSLIDSQINENNLELSKAEFENLIKFKQ